MILRCTYNFISLLYHFLFHDNLLYSFYLLLLHRPQLQEDVMLAYSLNLLGH